VGLDGAGVGLDGAGVGLDGAGVGLDGAGVGLDGAGVGLDGLRGEETGPGNDGELGALGEEPPFGLLVESEVVELEVSSEPCENVPRLVAWSRVSSRAWLLKTRTVGAATPLAVPLPPPPADRPARGDVVSEDDVDFESRAVSRAEPAPLPPAEVVEGDESGIA
jgi:hypothetical protein